MSLIKDLINKYKADKIKKKYAVQNEENWTVDWAEYMYDMRGIFLIINDGKVIGKGND